MRPRLPAQPRGRALRHPAPGRRRAPRPGGRRAGAAVQRPRQVGLVLRVSDEVQPGVVLVPGQRPDGEAVSGTVNMLCVGPLHRHGRGRLLPVHLPRRRGLERRGVSDLATLTATEQARLVRTRRASPVEVTEAVLDAHRGLGAAAQRLRRAGRRSRDGRRPRRRGGGDGRWAARRRCTACRSREGHHGGGGTADAAGVAPDRSDADGAGLRRWWRG